MVWANILLPGWGLSGERHRKWFSWCWFWEHKVFVDTELHQWEGQVLVLHGSPWVYTYSHCHQMITQQQPKGPRELVEVTQNL
jgi:hypothetical protein